MTMMQANPLATAAPERCTKAVSGSRQPSLIISIITVTIAVSIVLLSALACMTEPEPTAEPAWPGLAQCMYLLLTSLAEGDPSPVAARWEAYSDVIAVKCYLEHMEQQPAVPHTPEICWTQERQAYLDALDAYDRPKPSAVQPIQWFRENLTGSRDEPENYIRQYTASQYASYACVPKPPTRTADTG